MPKGILTQSLHEQYIVLTTSFLRLKHEELQKLSAPSNLHQNNDIHLKKSKVDELKNDNRVIFKVW
jgi:hypothetical protein